MYLEIPGWMLRRNSAKVAEAGLENTGVASLDHAKDCLGIDSYADKDILDIGCGVRFTATFINRGIPVKSYTGVELVEKLVDFLKTNVESKDRRFRFAYWNVHNARYNKTGTPMGRFGRFPVEGTFDIIWMWSVFTHLVPADSENMLRLARAHVRSGTKLFFSAFIDDAVDGFEDRDPVNTLTYAYYSKQLMASLIERTGWRIEAFHKPNPKGWVQSAFVCTPA